MPNKKRLTIDDVFIDRQRLDENSFCWRCEDADVLLEYPNKDLLIPTNKKTVLGVFLQDFNDNLEYTSKIKEIARVINSRAKNIPEVASVFVSFSESKERVGVTVLLNNKKYDRGVARKVFEIRIDLEEKYPDYNVDFLYMPILDNDIGDIISENSIKVFP